MLALDLYDSGLPLSSFRRDLLRLQSEMNQMLSGYSPRSARPFPGINLWRGDDSLYLTTELPGVSTDDLEISVVGDLLKLSGTLPPPVENRSDGIVYHRQERPHGRFTRTVQLPFRVEQDEVKAEFKNGVLTIILPQASSERPRKIQVKTE